MVAPNGDVYVTENSGNRIRLISNGIISTFAGTGEYGTTGIGDGGLATSAKVSGM